MRSPTAALARWFSTLIEWFSALIRRWIEWLAVRWRRWLVRRLGDRAADRINVALDAIAIPSLILFLCLILLSYTSYRANQPLASAPVANVPVANVPVANGPIVQAPPSIEQSEVEGSVFASVKQPSEIRGVWITNVASHILFSPWGIPRALDQLAALKFNTIYPVVWNRGNAFYRSQVLEKMSGQAIDPLIALTHPREDPLEEMVRVGHEKGLRVLPWFEYGFMIPLNSSLARQHPDWLTSRQNGSRRLNGELNSDTFEGSEAPTIESRGRLGRLLRSGAPSQLGWLNPMHPSVQGLLLSLVEEVVTAYDVDGIQFDDHLSLPVEFGYDDYTVALYRAEHQGQGPPDNPADADWIRWRAGKLSKFVNILHARVKADCERCTLSLSPNPAKFAYRFHLQDWQTWVREAWVDELVVQVYRDDLEQFERELDKNPLRTAARQIPVSIGILTGTWRHPIAFEQIQRQVESSRDRQFAGVSFFYWDTLWSYFTPEAPQRRREQFEQLLAVGKQEQ